MFYDYNIWCVISFKVILGSLRDSLKSCLTSIHFRNESHLEKKLNDLCNNFEELNTDLWVKNFSQILNLTSK